MYMMTPVLKTSRRLLLISSGRLFRIKLYYSVWIRFILIWIRGFPDPVFYRQNQEKSFYNVILLIKMKRIHNTILNYGLW